MREALRQLARENLVEVHARRGMFVSSVEVGDLAALSEVRARLESFAGRSGRRAPHATRTSSRRSGCSAELEQPSRLMDAR